MIRIEIYGPPTPAQLRMADLRGQLKVCSAMLSQTGDLAKDCGDAWRQFADADLRTLTGEDT